MKLTYFDSRMEELIKALISTQKLWSRMVILTRPCPVPRQPGVYAWYFKDISPLVPTGGCVTWQGLKLLYVGISPLSKNSQGNLAKRIRYHYRGNAYGSTLRRSLGCLLSEKLGIRLQRIGSSDKRTHFAEEEAILLEWMAENAFVTWIVREEPW